MIFKKKRGRETTHAEQVTGSELTAGSTITTLYMLHEAKFLGTITYRDTKQSSDHEHSQGRQEEK